MSPLLATDVHQHLWPEGFLAALARRSTAPAVRRHGADWVIQVPGEPDSPFGAADHDLAVREGQLQAAGLDRALLCMSTPLGVEALPGDEARPLLEAWHDGVFAAGAAFGVWGALPAHGATPADVDVLLDRGAVGVSLPAAALADRAAARRVAPVLARLARRDAPLLVHPGPAHAQAGGAPEGTPPWWPALTSYVAGMQAAWLAVVTWARPAEPRLRVCFAMLAGLAPLHAERLAARGGPHEVVRDTGLFYDTSSYGPSAVAAMAAAVGPEQLVHGSDRPVVAPPGPSGAEGRAAATVHVHRLLTGSHP